MAVRSSFLAPSTHRTWVARASVQAWQAVASSADGNRLVAAVNGGQIYTSGDAGVTWVARVTSQHWSGVASSSDGYRLVACVGQIAGAVQGQIYSSTDAGVTWLAGGVNAIWYAIASSADGRKLIASGAPYDPKKTPTSAIYVSTPATTSSSSATTAGMAGHLTGGQGTAIELQYIGNNLFLPVSHEGSIYGY